MQNLDLLRLNLVKKERLPRMNTEMDTDRITPVTSNTRREGRFQAQVGKIVRGLSTLIL